MEIFVSDNEKFIIFLLTNAWSIIKISRTFVSNYEDQYSLDDPPPACMHQFLQGWFLHHICYFDKPLNVVIVTISKTNRPTSIYFYLIAVYVVRSLSRLTSGRSFTQWPLFDTVSNRHWPKAYIAGVWTFGVINGLIQYWRQKVLIVWQWLLRLIRPMPCFVRVYKNWPRMQIPKLHLFEQDSEWFCFLSNIPEWLGKKYIP